MTKRTKAMLPALGPLIAAVIAFFAGSYRFTLDCDRDKATCDWEDGIFGGRKQTFAFTEIVTVRYEGDHGKYGGDGVVAIDLRDGSELEFAYGDDEEAKAETEVAKQFFDKRGERSYGFSTAREWAFGLSAIFMFTALVIVTSAAMKPKDETA